MIPWRSLQNAPNCPKKSWWFPRLSCFVMASDSVAWDSCCLLAPFRPFRMHFTDAKSAFLGGNREGHRRHPARSDRQEIARDGNQRQTETDWNSLKLSHQNVSATHGVHANCGLWQLNTAHHCPKSDKYVLFCQDMSSLVMADAEALLVRLEALQQTTRQRTVKPRGNSAATRGKFPKLPMPGDEVPNTNQILSDWDRLSRTE